MGSRRKNDTNELTYKTKRLTDLENELMVMGGAGGERKGKKDSQGIWDGYVHTAIFKMDQQQGCTVSHEDTQCSVLDVTWNPGWEGSLGEKGYMYLCS